MAVKIRLARRGRKKLAKFDVVVTDSRSPRDGKFIEKIGTYDPLTIPATIKLDEDKAFGWLMNGAQPSDTVRAMLSYRGVMMRRHLQIGVVKGAITQDQADQKLAEWKTQKDQKIKSHTDDVSRTKQEAAKARKEAETKIREARAEAIKKKAEAAEAEATAAAAATEATAATPEVEASEATPEATVAAPEAPAEGAAEQPAAEEPKAGA
jgi:small subunit ribosomal protein S16